MTASSTADTDSPSMPSGTKGPRRKSSTRKVATRKTATRKTATKRGATGAGTRAARKSSAKQSATGYSATASRLMSQGREALSGAYDWAADSAGRAGRALPRAASHLPNQRTMQSLIEDRPLVLGAIGLGLGAMIGMMLPSRLMMGRAPTRRPARRSSRKA